MDLLQTFDASIQLPIVPPSLACLPVCHPDGPPSPRVKALFRGSVRGFREEAVGGFCQGILQRFRKEFRWGFRSGCRQGCGWGADGVSVRVLGSDSDRVSGRVSARVSGRRFR